MIFSNGVERVFKSAVVAKRSIALHLLEDRQENGEDAAAPETFHADNEEWVSLAA